MTLKIKLKSTYTGLFKKKGTIEQVFYSPIFEYSIKKLIFSLTKKATAFEVSCF